MTDLFLTILNMSITASFLILPVIMLRIVFKNAPKWINCVMWSMVSIRLTLPFSKVEIVPLDPYKNSETNNEALSSGNCIGGYHNFSNFGQTPPSYNDPNSSDFQICWDAF